MEISHIMSDYFPTLDQFKKSFPNCKEPIEWFNAIRAVLAQNDITTKNQVLCFLAQCGHESNEFNVLTENFNYSSDRLLVIFPKYFNKTTAPQYHRQPQKIANKVYANRMGNGNESSGDGYKYRGRGVIQLTGKDNIRRFSKDTFGDDRVVTNPEMLLEKENAILCACWFWKINNLNTYADSLDMLGLTKKINGGTIGLQERIALLNRIQKITT